MYIFMIIFHCNIFEPRIMIEYFYTMFMLLELK